MIVCVQFYPEDGEQASVEFIDMNVLASSLDQDDQAIHLVIQLALSSPYKAEQIKRDHHADMTRQGIVHPPCQVDNFVTIYLE